MYIKPVVYIIDDDSAVRDSLSLLLSSQNVQLRACASAQEFWDWFEYGQVGCILLDLRMPIISGSELHEELLRRHVDLPVIIITGHGDVEQCRQAFQTGALDFLSKPIDQKLLLPTIRNAIEESIRRTIKNEQLQMIELRLSRITARERDVLQYLVRGWSSKQIAQELNLSPRTVDSYRANLFEKLEVNSLAKLIQFYLYTLNENDQMSLLEEGVNEVGYGEE